MDARLKPEQLAVRIDRSVYTIHAYERGVARPGADVLAALSKQLGCSIDSFYEGDDRDA